MATVLLITLSIAAFAAWLGFASAGAKRLDSQLGPALKQLLSLRSVSAVLFVKRPFSKVFIQIACYKVDDDQFGLEIGFPDVGWSSNIFPHVLHKCLEVNQSHTVTRSDDGDVQFLLIRFGRDWQRAEKFIQWILRDAVGYSKETSYRVRIDGL